MKNATTNPTAYIPWTPAYANESFDRAQALAQRLTDEDRTAGRPAPAYGYSRANFAKADQIVNQANEEAARAYVTEWAAGRAP
jgi:hypothetical protein